MKVNFKSLISLILVVAAVFVAVTIFTSNSGDKEEHDSYSDIIELFHYDLVTSFEVDETGKMTVNYLEPVRDKNGNITTVIPDGKTEPEAQIKKDKNNKDVTSKLSYQISYSAQIEEINSIAQKKI